MNVRKIRYLRRKSFIGKLLRIPFKLIPQTAIIPILSGKLSGWKWIKGSHNLSVLLGTYERLQSNEFWRRGASVHVFWDLGSHVGYYSLLFRASNPTGEIVAFEPVEKNARFFLKHMEINHVSGFKLLNVAVSDEDGMHNFNSGNTTVAGRLSDKGNGEVNVVRLSQLVKTDAIKTPQLIKMDIEGEEYKVLCDITPILKHHRPAIFLSTHGEVVHNACVTLLLELGYSLQPLDTLNLHSCRELFAS